LLCCFVGVYYYFVCLGWLLGCNSVVDMYICWRSVC